MLFILTWNTFVQEYIWRRQCHPTLALLPGKSHGQRSLIDCSPWGREESDTERLHFHFSLSCIGEGNGTPLQCSCLENPTDGGAWWAAVYGVTQSWTRLKRLSSSNMRKDKHRTIVQPSYGIRSTSQNESDPRSLIPNIKVVVTPTFLTKIHPHLP